MTRRTGVDSGRWLFAGTWAGAAVGRVWQCAAGMLLAGSLLAPSVPAMASSLEDLMRGMTSDRSGQSLLPPGSQAPQPPTLSSDEAARRVQQATGGQVLSTSPARRNGVMGYEVRVLVDGKRVRNVFVDNGGRLQSMP